MAYGVSLKRNANDRARRRQYRIKSQAVRRGARRNELGGAAGSSIENQPARNKARAWRKRA